MRQKGARSEAIDAIWKRVFEAVGAGETRDMSREELFEAWRRFLEALADRHPLVLVFEDLHWADDALLSFLEHLAGYAEGVPMLLVGTARPELFERAPTWASTARWRRSSSRMTTSFGSGPSSTVNAAPKPSRTPGWLFAAVASMSCG